LKVKANSKLLLIGIGDGEVTLGSGGIRGRERLKTNVHAVRVPRVLPRSTLDVFVTLVGNTSTGIVWFSFSGSFTHHIV
jgi:hypothetical protein